MSKNWLQEIYEKTPGVFTIYIPADLQEFEKGLIKLTKEHIKHVILENLLTQRVTSSIHNWTEERLLNELLMLIIHIMYEIRYYQKYKKDVVLVFIPEHQHWDMRIVCKAYSYIPAQL